MNGSWTTLTAIIGAVTGSVGVVLGVLNFISRRRVRLRVVPKLTAIRGGGFLSSSRDVLSDGFACIEVTNLSAFPVTLAEVGFDQGKDVARSVIIPEPRNLLPKRLEPRECIDVRANQSAGFPRKAKRAFASTQCKHTSYGDSIVFRKWRKDVKEMTRGTPAARWRPLG